MKFGLKKNHVVNYFVFSQIHKCGLVFLKVMEDFVDVLEHS